MMKYGAGNCICFETQLNDPINAGNQLLNSQSGWWSGQKYFSQATPYTDEEGWADKLSIYFLTNYDTNGTYPKITNYSIFSSITYLQYFKKPNETFALNYELCFLTLYNKVSHIKELFVGSAFMNNNVYTLNEKIYGKKFYLKYTLESDNDSFQYSVLDIKGHGTHLSAISGVNISNETYYINVGFKTSTTINAKTWAIVDENNDIYIASNTPKTFNDSNSNYHISACACSTRKDFNYD